jgi:hypothetical protein
MIDNSPIKICLVSPIPPPIGGISMWTSLMQQYARNRRDIRFIHVNTSPRWRKIHDLVMWKRLVGGGIQLISNFIELIIALLKKPDVIHLTTSGSIGTIRDLVIMITARIYHIPVVYHMRFGRIPIIALKRSFEWHILLAVYPLSL